MAMIDNGHYFALDDLPRGRESGSKQVEERNHAHSCKQQYNVGESRNRLVVANAADDPTQNKVSDEVNRSELGKALFLCQSEVSGDDHDTDEKSVNRVSVKDEFVPHASIIERGLTEK